MDCSKNTRVLLKKKKHALQSIIGEETFFIAKEKGIGVVQNMKETESQTKLSLKLQAYQYLKTRILNCEYRPNEFLNEQKLCAEMGNISRTPMRDALGRLEQEGLITILPKKGLMVSGITEEDVHSMFEMRSLVEPLSLIHISEPTRRQSIWFAV